MQKKKKYAEQDFTQGLIKQKWQHPKNVHEIEQFCTLSTYLHTLPRFQAFKLYNF